MFPEIVATKMTSSVTSQLLNWIKSLDMPWVSAFTKELMVMMLTSCNITVMIELMFKNWNQCSLEN